MSTNSIQDEDILVIRERLQDAYKKIVYIADNAFFQDSLYKRANQVLCSRIRKLDDIQESVRPTRVSDVIPESHLAKYGDFAYDEERERSYVPGVSSLELPPLACNCGPDDDEDIECWMLPEVERIFMHTVLMSTFNFKIYEEFEKRLAAMEHETGEKARRSMSQLFERAPGKPAVGELMNVEDVRLPTHFNVVDCDEMCIRKQILQDGVRDLWNQPKLEQYEKLLKVYKSSLENIFVESGHFKYLRCADTERSLQKLVDSIIILNEKMPQKVETVSTAKIMDEPPVKRLYSDVVQGNKSPTKQLQQSEDISVTPSKESTEELFSPRGNCEFFESPPQLEFTDIEESPCSLEYKASSPEQSDSKYSYSDAVNTSFQNDNILLNDYPIYDSFRNSTTNFQNVYNPVPYIPNTTVYNPNYRLGYTNTFTNTFAASQQIPIRPNVTTTNTCQQHPWFFSSYRPPSLCSYGNFLGQLLLPQMPTKHRWGTQHYARPVAPQNVFQPINQNWNMQNMYRSNPVQPQPAYSVYEPQKAKPSKKPQPAVPSTSKYVRSKTPEASSSCQSSKQPKHISLPKKGIYPGKILTKPNSDYKLMTRTADGLINFDSDSLIPIACSPSDDLEKIALREYQSSNEMFFNEIERQAEEQYDGNPENSCCPPNKCLLLGGHIAVYCFTCVFEI